MAGLVPFLRGWIEAGEVEHRREGKGHRGRRTFSSRPPADLGEGSCFVLTEAGSRHLGAAAEAMLAQPAGIVPRWYGGDLRLLLWMGCLLKSYHLRPTAENQEHVLGLLDRRGWPRHVTENPFPHHRDPEGALHNTLKQLNQQKRWSIRFRKDGTGEGFIWEPISGL